MATRAEVQAELDRLRAQVRELEAALERADEGPLRPPPFYVTYYVLAGCVLGTFGAATSLLFNVIGALLTGQHPLKLIQVYLTFGLGEKALVGEPSSLALAAGCCLYLATGHLLGVPVFLLLEKYGAGRSWGQRFLLASGIGLALWVINFYALLSWIQPLLFGGNWIVALVPWYVGAGTHLVFAWSVWLVQPLGAYRPFDYQAVPGPLHATGQEPAAPGTNLGQVSTT